MNQHYKKISGVLLSVFVLALAVWTVRSPVSLADPSSVTTAEVRVTICGNGILEGALIGGAETCDDGKHCADKVACSVDGDCAGIGDSLCIARSGDGCSATCIIEVTGGTQPPQYVTLTQIRAHPGHRSGSSGSNYDTQYYFSLYTSNDQNRQLRYQHPSLLTTNNSVVSNVYIVPPVSVSAGNYDAIIKSKAHLSRVLDNVYLLLGENNLNFTNTTNTTTIGSRVLIAGDINGAGTSLNTFGDDVINSVDISVLLQHFGSSDSSGNNVRANLNQNTTVDQSDLDILVGNLDMEGDL